MLSGHPEQLVMPPAPPLPAGPWLVTSAGTNTAHCPRPSAGAGQRFYGCPGGRW